MARICRKSLTGNGKQQIQKNKFLIIENQTIMTTEKKLGIWMDHANAHLMEYADPIVTRIITLDSTHEEKKFTLQKGESFMQRKNQQQEAAYYKTIADSIRIMMKCCCLALRMQRQSY